MSFRSCSVRAWALPAGAGRGVHLPSPLNRFTGRGVHNSVLKIAEDSPYDPLWGCRDRAGGYTGANLLGRALMRVRDELRAGPA